MSMSTHVTGFKPPDERWHQMKAIWDNCKAAKIAVPDVVETFFEMEEPSDAGVKVELIHYRGGDKQLLHGVEEIRRDGCSGFRVDLVKLKAVQPDVTVLEFENSW